MKKSPLALCDKCGLQKCRYLPNETHQAKIAIVGDMPYATDIAMKKLFTGAIGDLLHKCLKKYNLLSYDIAYLNILSCRPFKRDDITYNEQLCCSPKLKHELKLVNPDIIIILGSFAYTSICPILEITGFGHINKMLEILWNNKLVNIISTHHPNYVLNKRTEIGTFENTFSIVSKFLNNTTENIFQQQPKIEILDSLDKIQTWFNNVPYESRIAVDIETTGLNWYDRPMKPQSKLVMLAMAYKLNEGAVIPAKFMAKGSLARPIIQSFLNREDLTFIAHNGKFDAQFLKGNEQYSIDLRIDYDTMLAHYCINEERGTHGLKQLATFYLNAPDYEEELISKYLDSKQTDYSKIPFYEFAVYAVWDVCVTLGLMDIFEKELKQCNMWNEPYLSLLMPLSDILTKVELKGVPIDMAKLNLLKESVQNRMSEITKILQAMTNHLLDKPFNPNSTQQRAQIIFDYFKVTEFIVSKYDKKVKIKKRSTSKLAFEAFEKRGLLQDKGSALYHFITLLKEYKRIAKLNNSYIKSIPTFVDMNDRVHPSFMIHGTETGRLSVKDPALQTIPRASDKYSAGIKSCIAAPKGYTFILADYSQAELRMFAHVSQEPFLIGVYNRGEDLHSSVAKAMFGENFTKEQRTLCKTFNFAYLYGGGASSLDGIVGLDRDMAKEFVRRYNENMKVAAKWKEQQFKLATTQGYVSSIFNRRRHFPLITNEALYEIKQACTNMPIQSAASDLTCMSAIAIQNAGYNVIMLVHDSVMVEVKENEAEQVAEFVKNTMVSMGEHYASSVKWEADVEISNRWYKEV